MPMTKEDIVDKATAETTLKITWLKFGIAAFTLLGIAFGGGALGVSTQTDSFAANMAKLGDRVLIVEGVQKQVIADHQIDGQYGKTLDGFNRMAVEFSSGKSQHFLLVDEVKRNRSEIAGTRRDITKLVEGMGELKSDVRHLVRTVERKK